MLFKKVMTTSGGEISWVVTLLGGKGDLLQEEKDMSVLSSRLLFLIFILILSLEHFIHANEDNMYMG